MNLEWSFRAVDSIGRGLLISRGEAELADSYFRSLELLVFGPEPVFILCSEFRFRRQRSMTYQPHIRRGELPLPSVLAAGDRVEVLSTRVLLKALPEEVATEDGDGGGARLKVGPSAATLDVRVDFATRAGVDEWRRRFWVGWDEQHGVLLQFIDVNANSSTPTGP